MSREDDEHAEAMFLWAFRLTNDLDLAAEVAGFPRPAWSREHLEWLARTRTREHGGWQAPVID